MSRRSILCVPVPHEVDVITKEIKAKFDQEANKAAEQLGLVIIATIGEQMFGKDGRYRYRYYSYRAERKDEEVTDAES